MLGIKRKLVGRKMDLEKLPRNILVNEAIKVLENINNHFNKKFGEKLWKNFNVIKSGKALNGSSSSLFNKDKNVLSVFTTFKVWYFEIKCKESFLFIAPGSNPASNKIWNPLQIPKTFPPFAAYS